MSSLAAKIARLQGGASVNLEGWTLDWAGAYKQRCLNEEDRCRLAIVFMDHDRSVKAAHAIACPSGGAASVWD